MVSSGIRDAIWLKCRDYRTRQMVEGELGKVDFYWTVEEPSYVQVFKLYRVP